jgi:hypothetical protein
MLFTNIRSAESECGEMSGQQNFKYQAHLQPAWFCSCQEATQIATMMGTLHSEGYRIEVYGKLTIQHRAEEMAQRLELWIVL